MKQKLMKFDITPLTYIHIGSGEQLDPMNYLIKDGWAYYLDQLSCIRFFLAKYPKDFPAVMSSGIMKNMMGFFYDRFEPHQENLWYARYKVDPATAEEYLSKLSSWQNQNLVSAFIRTGLNKPFIPGSSVKGSLRTALVSNLVKEVPRNIRDDQLQGKLLNYEKTDDRFGKSFPDITKDPFKFLKLADIEFSYDQLSMKKAEIIGLNVAAEKAPVQHFDVRRGFPRVPNSFQKKDVKPKTQIPEFMEVIVPDGTSFSFTMSLTESIDRTTSFRSLFEYRDIDDFILRLLKITDTFYRKNLQKEEIFFRSINALPIHQKLQSYSIKEHECLIRFGKGSGQRFCTYEAMNYNPKTRRLIEKTPMGWCKLSLA